MSEEYQGEKNTPTTKLLCDLCDELAVFKGYVTSKYRGGVGTPYCLIHGRQARRDWVVAFLDELPSYVKWKAKQKKGPNSPSSESMF